MNWNSCANPGLQKLNAENSSNEIVLIFSLSDANANGSLGFTISRSLRFGYLQRNKSVIIGLRIYKIF